jgi:hypothetical protein
LLFIDAKAANHRLLDLDLVLVGDTSWSDLSGATRQGESGKSECWVTQRIFKRLKRERPWYIAD